MFKTLKDVDEDTVIKENNILLTRGPTDSLLSVNFEYSCEIYNSLMIEGDVTKNKE